MSDITVQSSPVRGFHHVAMETADFERSVRFYQEAFGFRVRTAWGEGQGRGIMLDTGDGSCLELFAKGQGLRPSGGWVHIALRTSDCRASLERALSRGATPLQELKEIRIPGRPVLPARIAFVKGPDGEEIELFEEI
nr:VOC family protein [uncultured Holophaga sp.]